MNKIYFDHSATTPVDPAVLTEMMPYFTDIYGNASSIHSFGQEAMAAVDLSRRRVAEFLNCQPEEIVFTSGATEANNLAIRGLVLPLIEKGEKPHIITMAIEHDAVLEPFFNLKKQGVETTFLPVDKNGVLKLDKLKKSIKENTVLVSIMYVNSEVGSVQPIREVGKIIKKINEDRLSRWQKEGARKKEPKPRKIYFHTDATQATNFFSCNTQHLHLDMLSFSGHKIYGPKGVGALFVKKNTPLTALQLGGHHEKNLRSGTLNVSGIVGLGKAVTLLNETEREKNNAKLAKLRDYLVAGVLQKVPEAILNTDRERATPAHAHFTFVGAEGEAILISLDLEGIAVSTGSACASGSLKASHVLLAMGIDKEIAHSSIRFTLGKGSTKKEIDELLKVLPPIIAKLRKMNPLYKK